MKDCKSYIRKLDGLTKQEIAQWHVLQGTQHRSVSPFVTYEFAQAAMNSGRVIYVAFICQDGELVLLFPFEYRSLLDRLLLVPSRVGGRLSDCMVGLNSDFMKASLDTMFTVFHGVDFDHAPMSSWAIEAVETKSIRIGWRLDLSVSLDQYWSDRVRCHKSRMANLANRRRKLIRENGEILLVETSHPSSEQVGRVIDMKRHQYHREGVPDVFEDYHSLSLLESLRVSDQSKCQLFLSELYVGEKLIAAHLGLKVASRLHYWFPVYDESLRPYSPGLLLLEEIINQMPKNGLDCIDFGEGDSEYKRMFATTEYSNFKSFLTKPSLRGVMARVAESIRWRLSRLW